MTSFLHFCFFAFAVFCIFKMQIEECILKVLWGEKHTCVCVCVCVLFVIAVYDTSLEAVVHASADCVLFLSPSVIFIFFSITRFLFSCSLCFEICEGIFQYLIFLLLFRVGRERGFIIFFIKTNLATTDPIKFVPISELTYLFNFIQENWVITSMPFFWHFLKGCNLN